MRTAITGLVTMVVLVGCGGNDAVAPPTAEVLGAVVTEGGELRTRDAEAPPSPSVAEASSSPASPAPSRAAETAALEVTSATVSDTLNWGLQDDGSCAGILDPEQLASDEYVFRAGVRPFVEGDCPDWHRSYPLTCVGILQGAAELRTTMRGAIELELFVDGRSQASWALDVEETLEPGGRLHLDPGETVGVASGGRPDVTCRVRFTAA